MDRLIKLFPVDDRGTAKTAVQYFKEKDGYDIQLDLPCLKVGDRQSPTYLPIEVCEIADGQQISHLLNVTFQHPFDREKTILQIVNPYNGDPYAKEFGVTFENKLAIIKGRVLPPPMLKFGDQGKEKVFWPKVGKWNMRSKKMVDGGAVNTWTCINFASDIMRAAAVAFCDELAVMCLVSGMNFRGDPVLPVVNARPKYVESALKKHHKRVMKILRPQGKELDLLIVILPDNNGTLYGDIKRICETDIGLVSQCCLAKHVLPMKPRYLANIALKINAKVGGRNTVLVDAVERNLPRVGNTPTIIFGADVSHPHPGEGPYSPSIAAVVASQDWPEVTKYAGSVRPQAHREEIIQCLFNKTDCKSGCIPGGMIKDVVSKEKLNQVLEHELSAIKKACASVDPIYNPQVTIIMVQRRHHTRLFTGNYGIGSTVFRSGNVLWLIGKYAIPPTLIFTCVAMLALRELAGLYARCTSSVSVVPPVYYAHLLASQARLYIKPGDTGELSFPEIKDSVKNSGMFFC
ncbi:protein argonaute 1B-like [Aegilops tauschii subsp. strangulata]|uniref:protein argonaute 1B-like n=1 Tax=Aegilops tauschii subsp. strangulata TaxID=200361 RepID=UPI001E1CAC9F|nr:protein argonaute 1B-like [Aegilops tauschii subsp. strangulata]